MPLSTKLELRGSSSSLGLFARELIASGEPLTRFEGTVGMAPSRFSLQVGEELHLHGVEGQPEEFVNHACEPNCYVDFDSQTLITLRDIAEGEEITFNYLTSEWECYNPFFCECGSPRCFKFIRGYRYLSPVERERIAPLAAPFLKRKVAAATL